MIYRQNAGLYKWILMSHGSKEMLRSTVLYASPCIKTLVKNTNRKNGLRIRNQQEDCKRITSILNVLDATKYGLQVPSINRLVKCLYVEDSLKVKVKPTKRLGLKHLELKGRTLLKSEFITAKSQINTRNMEHLVGSRKLLMENKKIGTILSTFLQMRGLEKLARLPLPDNRLSAKALSLMDMRAFCSVLGCLAYHNDKKVMSDMIQNEITKPTLRNLFGL